VWSGDILTLYRVMGLLLPTLLRLAPGMRMGLTASVRNRSLDVARHYLRRGDLLPTQGSDHQREQYQPRHRLNTTQ
jgi:hypothetical protein